MNSKYVLFEMAAQMKFRYPYRGLITTEDLYDLNNDQLDQVYKTLVKELKSIDGESLITSKSADEGVKINELKNKIAIVKHVFEHKQGIAELHRLARENAAKKQRIMEAIAAKQENALQNMSEDDLKKMLDELG